MSELPKRGRGRGRAGAGRGRGRGTSSTPSSTGRGRGRGRPRGAASSSVGTATSTTAASFENVDITGALDHVRFTNLSSVVIPVDDMTWEVLQTSWGRPNWPLGYAINDGVISCSTCGPAWAVDVIPSTPYSNGSTNSVVVAVAPLLREDPLPNLYPTPTAAPCVNGIQFWNAEVLAPSACRRTRGWDAVRLGFRRDSHNLARERVAVEHLGALGPRRRRQARHLSRGARRWVLACVRRAGLGVARSRKDLCPIRCWCQRGLSRPVGVCSRSRRAHYVHGLEPR
jgi:hypothetical protein